MSAAQTRIQNGMSGLEVIEALGSPNIITTDREGKFGRTIKFPLSNFKLQQWGRTGTTIGERQGNALIGTGLSVGETNSAVDQPQCAR